VILTDGYLFKSLYSLLPTPMIVTWVCFSPLFICFFFQMICQKPMQLDIEMFHDETWKPIISRSEVKVTMCLSVFRHNEMLLLLLHMLGFSYCGALPNKQCQQYRVSLCHFPASPCHWMLGFARCGFLHSCECWLSLVNIAVSDAATLCVLS